MSRLSSMLESLLARLRVARWAPAVLAAVLGSLAPSAGASADAKKSPDETLGTLVVDGSADVGGIPLQKLAVLPLVTKGNADTVLQLVVRRDLQLSGQFDVVAEATAPPGPFLHDTPVDVKAWHDKGVEVLVRVTAEDAGPKSKLTGEAWLLASGKPDPAFTQSIEVSTQQARLGAHRMTDALLEALTGRAGGFASKLVYTARVGKGQQVFVSDADGFDLHGYGPAAETALAPAFGPSGEIYYALSTNFSPFRLVHGENATPHPLSFHGSILGVAFSSDRTRMAITSMKDGVSQLFIGKSDGSSMMALHSPPLATHPTFGPLGKIAWTAGSPQRVLIAGRHISPAGLSAATPTFCDGPRGLLVIFSVGVGADTDLVATDSSGGGLFRLTQGQGANTYPACSPDGRLVAFFSTRRSGPGLYMMPISAPSRAQRIANEVGASLRWEAMDGKTP